jgi:uncharacterized membrane protein
MEFWIAILTLWAFYRWVASRIRRQKEDERFARVVEALNRLEPRLKDISKLESRVKELEQRVASPMPPGPAETEPVAAAPSPAARKPVEPPPVVPPAPEIQKPVAPVVPPPAAPAVPPHTPPTSGAPGTEPPAAQPFPPLKPAAPPPLHRPAPPPRTPPPPSPSRGPTPVSPRELGSQLEQTLGANWLNKIGIIALVIGISLFLAYKFPSLSNSAKIILCYAVSFVILGTGVYLERLDRYRVFARALVGGGWALTFFVTYAMHFVPYTRVIDTQSVDLILLFLVAAVMVVHTLRYDSQVVTGLAFLLAFTTVAISQNTIYSLSAGAILALGLVAIVHRRQWFELEIFGILASYGNHFIWLAKVIVPAAGHHRTFPEFLPSTILLCLYWVTYRWSYIARRIQTPAQENVSTLAALLDTSLLLALFKYQSVRPELAFYALLLLGAVELALGQLPATRRRRIAFIILSTMGVILLVAAIPFKYSGMDTAIIWLAEAQMLLLAGVFSPEILFRSFGLLVALLTSGDMLIRQALPILYDRLSQPLGLKGYGPAVLPHDRRLAISFLVAGLLFYANSLVIPRRWKELIPSPTEKTSFRAFSYLAGLLLATSIWLAFVPSLTTVIWAGTAVLLILVGRTLHADDLTYQAHLFALAAFVRALAVNALLPDVPVFPSLRLVTLALVIVAFYLSARWLSEHDSDYVLAPSEIYTSASAILLVVLAYRECNWVWIAAAWGTFALVLAVAGHYGGRRDLSLQAHVLVLAGFGRTLLVNMDATEQWHHFTLRFLTFTLMAALLYLCAYFSGPRGTDAARLLSALDTWAGSILIAVLAFKEISSPWIAVAWSVFALLLLIIGDRVKRIHLHLQAYLLSVSAMVQIVSVNLDAIAPFSLIPLLSLRFVTLAIVSPVFYLCARWAVKGQFAQARLAGAAYNWAASGLIIVLIYFEAAAGAVALGWALFALALFELGVWRKSRNFRAQGYLAFLLSFLRILYFNLDTGQAQLTFFVLPVALLFYYAYQRLARLTGAQSRVIPHHGEGPDVALVNPFAFDRQIHAAAVLAYLGSATLVLFAHSYFPGGSRLICWALLSVLFIGIAWSTQRDIFFHHSVLVAFLVFFRALGYELQIGGRPGLPGSFSPAFYVSVATAVLFAGLAFAFPLRQRFATRAKSNGSDGLRMDIAEVLSRPEQIYFFLPFILVTLLILNEISFGRVTIAWGIEAVVAFLFALVAGERSFRLAGLGLLLVCVAKIGLLDVWRQHGSDRYITLIILGIALLLVSYLYTRYSEAIRRYL